MAPVYNASMTPGTLIERLAATPGILANLLAESTDDQLDATTPGEWPARVVAAHLRDNEILVMRLRLERMLSEDGPVFPNFDEKAWAATRSLARDRKEQILADFALQRHASLNILRSLRPRDWRRAGRHEQYGAFTVTTWLARWAEHDAAHLAQLERCLGETFEAVRDRRARRDPLA